MSDIRHEADHTGPIKNPKQLLTAVFFSFMVPIFAIIGLVTYVTSANKPAEGAADPTHSITQRIERIGMVEVRDANRPLVAGEAVFKGQCSACHATGAAGAPKFGDSGAWAPRIKSGYEALLHSALAGKGAMAPQGGGDYEDTEIGRAVVYMANAGGANFDEPQRPAAAPADGASAAGVAAAPGAAAALAAAAEGGASAAAQPAPVSSGAR